MTNLATVMPYFLRKELYFLDENGETWYVAKVGADIWLCYSTQGYLKWDASGQLYCVAGSNTYRTELWNAVMHVAKLPLKMIHRANGICVVETPWGEKIIDGGWYPINDLMSPPQEGFNER